MQRTGQRRPKAKCEFPGLDSTTAKVLLGKGALREVGKGDGFAYVDRGSHKMWEMQI